MKVLVLLDILLVLSVLFVFCFLFNDDSIAASIIAGTNDGSAIISIHSHYPWKVILKYLLLIVTLDFTLFTIIAFLEHRKINHIGMKYWVIIICVLNILTSLLLFPAILIFSVIISIILLAAYSVMIIYKKYH